MIKTEVFETINRNTAIYNRNKKARTYSTQCKKRKAERKEDILFILGILIGVPTTVACAYYLVKALGYICMFFGGVM